MPSDSRHTSGIAARRRNRVTRKSVLVADKLADWTITIGGLGVILAVFGIMVFLAQVVVPLFTGGALQGEHRGQIAAARGAVLVDLVDEYRTVSVALTDAGEISAFHIASAKPIRSASFDFGGATVSAFGRTIGGNDLAFGFADGTVRFAKLGFAVRILSGADVPGDLRPLDGTSRTDGAAVYTPVPGGQVRRVGIELQLGEPIKIGDGLPIAAIDYRLGGTVERPTQAFVTIDSAGVVRLSATETKMNLLTRKATVTTDTSTLPPLPAGTKPAYVLMTEKADQVFVGETSGLVHRFDTRDFNKPQLAESIDLFPGPVELTALKLLLGEQTIVAGGSDGSVDAYFRLRRAGARSSDGYTLVRAHRLDKQPAPIVAIDVSKRSKMLVTAARDGSVWLRHSTSEQVLLKLKSGERIGDFKALVLAPRDDGVLLVGAGGAYVEWDVAVPHPETTWSSIFGKVWYEGYDKPEFTWQSSSGTDSFEPKLSLVPLIFGTLKATFYSLLFAVPIALLAAIFTSEFLHPRVRGVVKPAMEMMASLPSVVLGFLAALILAPLVENSIAAVMLALLTVPLSLFVGAYLWQLLPQARALRFGGIPKLVLMLAALLIGLWLAGALAGAFERGFFAGDFKAWTGGTVGSSAPVMTLLLLPPAFLAVAAGWTRSFGGALQARMRQMPRGRAGMIDGGRWLLLLAAALALAAILAQLLTGLGWDVRGGMIDTYVQRNTLVVGFAMGFAVIPIIYTIAEDALNSVPEHLRAASLACGATPWQTATRVILPTAASGVFAAIMIGMGRAVGETMIVVMAAGNTPILDWNVFNGLRALSANIAVELPEAVKDGTLYRMLFLAALSLFVMTFVINTAAELVRQRFRKRAAQM